MAAYTIDEVIQQLKAIINSAIDTGNRLGYFAALYHKVTVRVKEGILNNEFENGPRMEKLDVIFANRYLEAVTQYKNGQRPTGSWHKSSGYFAYIFTMPVTEPGYIATCL